MVGDTWRQGSKVTGTMRIHDMPEEERDTTPLLVDIETHQLSAVGNYSFLLLATTARTSSSSYSHDRSSIGSNDGSLDFRRMLPSSSIEEPVKSQDVHYAGSIRFALCALTRALEQFGRKLHLGKVPRRARGASARFSHKSCPKQVDLFNAAQITIKADLSTK